MPKKKPLFTLKEFEKFAPSFRSWDARHLLGYSYSGEPLVGWIQTSVRNLTAREHVRPNQLALTLVDLLEFKDEETENTYATLLDYSANCYDPQEQKDKALAALVAKRNVNDKDQYGFTLLHSAAMLRRENVVKELIETYGANPKILSNSGESVLHVAVKYGCSTVVNQLLEYDLNLLTVADSVLKLAREKLENGIEYLDLSTLTAAEVAAHQNAFRKNYENIISQISARVKELKCQGVQQTITEPTNEELEVSFQRAQETTPKKIIRRLQMLHEQLTGSRQPSETSITEALPDPVPLTDAASVQAFLHGDDSQVSNHNMQLFPSAEAREQSIPTENPPRTRPSVNIERFTSLANQGMRVGRSHGCRM